MNGETWYFAVHERRGSKTVELHLFERPSARRAWVSRGRGRAAVGRAQGAELLESLPRCSVVYHRSAG